MGLFPSLCIWLAYLLPAHSMAGLYTYTTSSDTGIYLYMGRFFSLHLQKTFKCIYVYNFILGYMLLYLTFIQTLALFCAHLMPCKVSAMLVNTLITLGLTAVGGYSVHPKNLSKIWSWSELISPEKWLLPVLVQDEYSVETLANSAGLQLCRNKQVSNRKKYNSPRQFSNPNIFFFF